MSVALETTCGESDDDDGAFEEFGVHQPVVSFGSFGLAFRYQGGCSSGVTGEYADVVQPLQPPDLFRRFQPIHDRQLDIHQDQVESSLPPFCDRLAPVHGGVPADFEALHKCFEELEVDDVVFDDENVDRRDGAFEESGGELELGFRLSIRFETGRGSPRRRRSFLADAVRLDRRAW